MVYNPYNSHIQQSLYLTCWQYLLWLYVGHLTSIILPHADPYVATIRHTPPLRIFRFLPSCSIFGVEWRPRGREGGLKRLQSRGSSPSGRTNLIRCRIVETATRGLIDLSWRRFLRWYRWWRCEDLRRMSCPFPSIIYHTPLILRTWPYLPQQLPL